MSVEYDQNENPKQERVAMFTPIFPKEGQKPLNEGDQKVSSGSDEDKGAEIEKQLAAEQDRSDPPSQQILAGSTAKCKLLKLILN